MAELNEGVIQTWMHIHIAEHIDTENNVDQDGLERAATDHFVGKDEPIPFEVEYARYSLMKLRRDHVAYLLKKSRGEI